MKYLYKFFEHSKSDPIPELTWKKDNKLAIFVFGTPASGKSTFIKDFVVPKLRSFKIFNTDSIQKKLVKIGKDIYSKSEDEFNEKMDTIRNAINTFNSEYDLDLRLSDKDIKDIIDNNVFVKGSSEIMEKMLINYMLYSNSDFIFDTTGNDFYRIKKYSILARKNNYDILFLKIKVDFKQTVIDNLNRYRVVQPDYQLHSIKRSEKLEQVYLKLDPDAYYIYDRDNKKFTKLK